MVKIINCLLIVLAIAKLSNGQILNISGNIKDINNKPISLVSVTIEKQQNGVATDFEGNFKLTVPEYSKITFSSVGYNDTVVIINSESPLSIILKPSEKDLGNLTVTDYVNRYQSNNDLQREIVATDFANYSAENKNGGMYYGAAIPEFHTKEDTKGSLYLFNNWHKGVIANNNDGNLIADTENYYNINKITGDLVMTRDFKSALNINKSQVKFATLYDSLKNTYTFLIVPVINPTLLCQVIALGNTYNIFKLTTTKFTKTDFHTDGFATTGNNYDEYVDTNQYYLLNIKDGTVIKFELKKKEIRYIFANNTSAQQFLTAHKSEDVNDVF